MRRALVAVAGQAAAVLVGTAGAAGAVPHPLTPSVPNAPSMGMQWDGG
jgi:hypothetical protein